jgi:hypothetical protein
MSAEPFTVITAKTTKTTMLKKTFYHYYLNFFVQVDLIRRRTPVLLQVILFLLATKMESIMHLAYTGPKIVRRRKDFIL